MSEFSPHLKIDLRWMLVDNILERALNFIDAGRFFRDEQVLSGHWDKYCGEIRGKIKKYLGDLVSGKELKPKKVSEHKFRGFRVENVVFESLPGWTVNASVFLPETPPPWPAVIMPLGQGGKVLPDHQIPAQIFAMSGYAAIIFDPPMSGEKNEGSDIFHDGIRCCLTDESSQKYFVADAIRAVDYMFSREDINTSPGAAITGVSGGGQTAVWSALIDDRISCVGAVCCLAPLSKHRIGDLYVSSPEIFPVGRIEEGIDDIDLAAGLMPKPLLVMAGRRDEVLRIEWARELSDEVLRLYNSAGMSEKFNFFVDDSGRAYTLPMAMRFVQWMNTWMRKKPDIQLPEIEDGSITLLTQEQVSCKAEPGGNIFTIQRRIGRHLREKRPAASKLPVLQEKVKHITKSAAAHTTASSLSTDPHQVWRNHIEEILLMPEKGIEIPATFLYPAESGKKHPAILYFDEDGRWTDMRNHGPMVQAVEPVKDKDHCCLFSVDLPGWGDTASHPVPYDISSYAGNRRQIAYLANASGDSLLSMKIRYALVCFKYLAERGEVDPDRIIVGGKKLGAVVALHLAVLEEKAKAFFGLEMLCSFQTLLETEEYRWNPDAFLPKVLTEYDLPDLLGGLNKPCLLVNPLDGQFKQLDEDLVALLYGHAKTANKKLEVRTNAPGNAHLDWLIKAI